MDNETVLKKVGYKRPLELLSAVIYAKYGTRAGLKEIDFNNYFTIMYNISLDNLKDISSTLVGIDDKKDHLLNYNENYSKIFFNTGRLAFLSMLFEIKETEKIPLNDNKSDSPTEVKLYDNLPKEVVGMSKGLAEEFGEFSYKSMLKIFKDFESENEIDTVDPMINIGPYFSEDVRCLNSKELIPIINTSLFYIIIGYVFGNIEDSAIKELFKYKENIKSGDPVKILNYLKDNVGAEKEKIYNFCVMCMLYDKMTTYIEKSIGLNFNSKFSYIFRSIGRGFVKTNKSIDVIDDTTQIPDIMVSLLTRILDTKSLYYLGDGIDSLRPMFVKHINNSKQAYEPAYILSIADSEEIDFLTSPRLENYKSVIDISAYNDAIKSALIYHRNILTDKNKYSTYIKSWYYHKYYEKLIYKAFTHWEKSKTPLKIEGIEDLYVEIDIALNDSTKMEYRNINKIEYSKAYALAMNIIYNLNARYCEAHEYLFCVNANRSFNSDYYKRLSSVKVGHFAHDSIVDAIRDNQYGKYPYLITIGNYSQEDINTKVLNGNLDMNKLKKLGVLDDKFENLEKSVCRPPYEIIRDNNLNYFIIEGSGGASLANKITSILKELNNDEYLYIVR